MALGMRNQRLLICLVAMFATSGCISELQVEGRACPCPGGYICCATLDACVSEPAHCPDLYPPSTAKTCERDADCQRQEICRSWLNKAGDIAGPKECRRKCSAAFPCADGEVCELILHDGQKLESLMADRACVPKEPSKSCGGLRCSECSDKELGRTFCRKTTIGGCFITLSEQCGLSCKLMTVEDCFPSECTVIKGVPRCGYLDVPEPCKDFACSKCVGAQSGKTHCDGNQIVGCAKSSYDGKDCSEICHPFSQTCPTGWTCDDSAGARCLPPR